jgi:hypothetical protein
LEELTEIEKVPSEEVATELEPPLTETVAPATGVLHRQVVTFPLSNLFWAIKI